MALALSRHRPLSPGQLGLPRAPRHRRRRLLFLALSRVPTVLGEPATAPGIDDVYGRTPVIGWSRFIDGRISRLERARRARDARRGIPAAIPISGEFPRTLRLPFRNFRLRVTDLSESVVTRPRLSLLARSLSSPLSKVSRIFRVIKHRILNTALLRL